VVLIGLPDKVKNILASTWLFQLLNWVSLIPYLLEIVSHWSPVETLWKPSQLTAVPGMVGELLGADSVVVGLVAVVVVLMDGVLGSSVAVPITQYDLLVSRLGQAILGFSFCRSLIGSPHALAKLEHVAPASAVVEKSKLTARGTRAAPIAGTIPMARIAMRCIVWDLKLDYIENKSISGSLLLRELRATYL
jgi:hypothetical protein